MEKEINLRKKELLKLYSTIELVDKIIELESIQDKIIDIIQSNTPIDEDNRHIYSDEEYEIMKLIV